MTQPIPEDIDSLRNWFPAIRHMRSVARQSTGYAIVTLRVIVNEFGQPAGLWIMPELTRLVPRYTADQALAEVVKGLTSE